MSNSPTKKKKTKLTDGDFVLVELSEGKRTFARLFFQTLFYAFYDFCGESTPSLEKLAALPVLFKTSVELSGIKSGRWKIIGNLPLVAEFDQPIVESYQDMVSKELFLKIWEPSKESAKFVPVDRVEFDKQWPTGFHEPAAIEAKLRKHFGIPTPAA